MTTEPKNWHDVVKHQYREEGCTIDHVLIANGANTVDSPLVQCTLLGQVTATGEFLPLNPAASDGSETAAAILYSERVDASTSSQPAVAMLRGPSTISWAGLELVNPLDAAQTATAQADLMKIGIKTLETA